VPSGSLGSGHDSQGTASPTVPLIEPPEAGAASTAPAVLARPGTPLRRGALLLAVGVAYYLGARVGLSLALVADIVTPLWPPTGIALTAFLILGRRVWPAVTLAALAVNLPAGGSVIAAAVTALGNTASPLVAASLLTAVGFRRQLDRQRDAMAIVFLGALASMTVSATIGTTALALTSRITSMEVLTTWFVWWTGDAMGVLVFAPFLLSLPLLRRSRWGPGGWLEAGAVLALALVTAFAAVLVTPSTLFLTLPVIGWAAWRLLLPGAAPAALVVSLVATWAAAGGRGLFADTSTVTRMLVLQAFNACVALTSFFLAALVAERRGTDDALTAAATELGERLDRGTEALAAAKVEIGATRTAARHEREIAETLRRTLVPQRIVSVPGAGLSARYVPATSDVRVGGDWHDLLALRDGLIGIVIGDVAGHGVQAAAAMAQVRMAVRAYAVQDPSPASVVGNLHTLVADLAVPRMVTLTYAVLDPATRRLRLTSAGHPPGVLIGPDGARLLEGAHTPPLGVTREITAREEHHDLEPGMTLLLYTDGLIERRGESLEVGLARLLEEVGQAGQEDLEALADRVLAALVDRDNLGDDVALVLLRTPLRAADSFEMTLPAEARNLRVIRTALRTWLREVGVSEGVIDDVVVSCGEACANVVQHAYAEAAGPGPMQVETRVLDGLVELTVRDQGRWRPPSNRDGGWGNWLVQAVAESVDVERSDAGTTVRVRHRVDGAVPAS
jgi:serine phosphatase RsbU (regulator of sigma subunit)/integral membrane sensor domain MASE1/anti-sigma regulatory factor (Ser/Thr protein kinase)